MIEKGSIIQRVKSHPETRGWFMGHFIPEGDFFHSKDFELKYHPYKKGEKHIGSTTGSKRRTIGVLLQGKVRISFPSLSQEYILESAGDYIADDEIPGDHEIEALEDSIMIAIRTPSKSI